MLPITFASTLTCKSDTITAPEVKEISLPSLVHWELDPEPVNNTPFLKISPVILIFEVDMLPITFALVDTITSLNVEVPVKMALSIFAFTAIAFRSVVDRFGSFPKASAISFNVSNVAGAEFTRLPIIFFTYWVVATWVLLSMFDTVGAYNEFVKVPSMEDKLAIITFPEV